MHQLSKSLFLNYDFLAYVGILSVLVLVLHFSFFFVLAVMEHFFQIYNMYMIKKTIALLKEKGYVDVP